MKKRTKITLRTKIYLTIVLLLALTGVFYASNPTFFTFVPFATGVAASQTNLLVSEYCTDNIDTVACDGTVSLFATIPGFGSCREKYMAIAPSQSAAAGFTPRDVFVNPRSMVFKIPERTFCSGGAFFQSEQQITQAIYQYPLSDFTGLGGNVLVTSEQGGLGADTSLVTFNGTNYVQSSFGPRVPGVNEGASFVDCDVPTPTPTPTPTVTPTTCGSSFVIGDLDAVVGNHVTFWGGQWWKLNHLSGGSAPASFKGFANCTNPNPPACGGTWQSTPGNSSGAPESVPADITVIVSSLITKSGPIISGDVPMMVIVHTDPGYEPNPGHKGTGTVTAVVCP